jgi:hypothetical protein
MNTPALRSQPRPVPTVPAFRPLAVPALPAGRPPSLPAPERPVAQPRRPQLVLPTPATRRGPAREVIAALLLLFAWTLLWGFFVTAVAEPGAQLAARAIQHPSVAPAAR